MNLNYPVFATNTKHNMIYVFFKEKDLKSTSTDLLNKNIFNGVVLIDSKGDTYKIKKVHIVKYIGFYGFSLLKKGRQVLVDFEYENEKSIFELSDFKQYIVLKIENSRRFYDSSMTKSELKSEILNCSSFEEVANLIK
jgi:hypothetical protein